MSMAVSIPQSKAAIATTINQFDAVNALVYLDIVKLVTQQKLKYRSQVVDQL
jgi:hypothetical protein